MLCTRGIAAEHAWTCTTGFPAHRHCRAGTGSLVASRCLTHYSISSSRQALHFPVTTFVGDLPPEFCQYSYGGLVAVLLAVLLDSVPRIPVALALMQLRRSEGLGASGVAPVLIKRSPRWFYDFLCSLLLCVCLPPDSCWDGESFCPL